MRIPVKAVVTAYPDRAVAKVIYDDGTYHIHTMWNYRGGLSKGKSSPFDNAEMDELERLFEGVEDAASDMTGVMKSLAEWNDFFPELEDGDPIPEPDPTKSPREDWKQDNPKDQRTVLLMALQGHFDETKCGLPDDDYCQSQATKADAMLEQLHDLNKHLDGVEWPQ